jgi:hypothetical protein
MWTNMEQPDKTQMTTQYGDMAHALFMLDN